MSGRGYYFAGNEPSHSDAFVQNFLLNAAIGKRKQREARAAEAAAAAAAAAAGNPPATSQSMPVNPSAIDARGPNPSHGQQQPTAGPSAAIPIPTHSSLPYSMGLLHGQQLMAGVNPLLLGAAGPSMSNGSSFTMEPRTEILGHSANGPVQNGQQQQLTAGLSAVMPTSSQHSGFLPSPQFMANQMRAAGGIPSSSHSNPSSSELFRRETNPMVLINGQMEPAASASPIPDLSRISSTQLLALIEAGASAGAPPTSRAQPSFSSASVDAGLQAAAAAAAAPTPAAQPAFSPVLLNGQLPSTGTLHHLGTSASFQQQLAALQAGAHSPTAAAATHIPVPSSSFSNTPSPFNVPSTSRNGFDAADLEAIHAMIRAASASSAATASTASTPTLSAAALHHSPAALPTSSAMPSFSTVQIEGQQFSPSHQQSGLFQARMEAAATTAPPTISMAFEAPSTSTFGTIGPNQMAFFKNHQQPSLSPTRPVSTGAHQQPFHAGAEAAGTAVSLNTTMPSYSSAVPSFVGNGQSSVSPLSLPSPAVASQAQAAAVASAPAQKSPAPSTFSRSPYYDQHSSTNSAIHQKYAELQAQAATAQKTAPTFSRTSFDDQGPSTSSSCRHQFTALQVQAAVVAAAATQENAAQLTSSRTSFDDQEPSTSSGHHHQYVARQEDPLAAELARHMGMGRPSITSPATPSFQARGAKPLLLNGQHKPSTSISSKTPSSSIGTVHTPSAQEVAARTQAMMAAVEAAKAKRKAADDGRPSSPGTSSRLLEETIRDELRARTEAAADASRTQRNLPMPPLEPFDARGQAGRQMIAAPSTSIDGRPSTSQSTAATQMISVQQNQASASKSTLTSLLGNQPSTSYAAQSSAAAAAPQRTPDGFVIPAPPKRGRPPKSAQLPYVHGARTTLAAHLNATAAHKTTTTMNISSQDQPSTSQTIPTGRHFQEPAKRKYSQISGGGPSSSSNASGPPPKRKPLEITKRPSSSATCAEFTAYLNKYAICSEFDDEYIRKAFESLHKKIKDKPDQMETIFTVVDTEGREPGGCIPVQRTLDGRLQVNGKKGFPHVIFARIFRFPETNKNLLKSLPICKHGFDTHKDQPGTSQKLQKHEESDGPLCCINPWHYEETEAKSAAIDDNVQFIIHRHRQLGLGDNSTMAAFLPPEGIPLPFYPQPLRIPEQPADSLPSEERLAQEAAVKERWFAVLHSSNQLAQHEVEELRSQVANIEEVEGERAEMALRWQYIFRRPLHPLDVQRMLTTPVTQQIRLPPPPSIAPAGVANDGREEKPKSMGFMMEWEGQMRWKAPGMFSLWKTEERRLLSIDPPRFVPLKKWNEFVGWYRAYEAYFPGFIAPLGWFDVNDTVVVPEDQENQGHLARFYPYDHNPRPQDLQRSEAQQNGSGMGGEKENREQQGKGQNVRQERVCQNVQQERACQNVQQERAETPFIDVVTLWDDEEDGPSCSYSLPSASQPSSSILPPASPPAVDVSSSPSDAAAHAVAMAYSQQGHFSAQLQIEPQQPPQSQTQQQPQQQKQQSQQPQDLLQLLRESHQRLLQPQQPQQQQPQQPTSLPRILHMDPNLEPEEEADSSSPDDLPGGSGITQ